MTVIVSHSKDMDGVSSAAILKRAFPKAKVFLVDYEEITPMLKRLEKSSGTLLISDLNIGAREKGAINSLRKISKARRIRWFDHHNWDKKTMKEVEKYVDLNVDRDKCAAQVVASFFGHGDSVAQKIARYAADQDFYVKKLPQANRLTDMIAAKQRNRTFLVSLVKMLSRGAFWKRGFGRIRGEYLRKKGRLLEKALGGTTYYNGFAISYASPFVPAGEIVKRTGKGVLTILDASGRMSFRRKGVNVDLSSLGREFGGGGHPYASGGHYGKKVGRKDLSAARAKIAQKISKWLLKH